MAWESVSVRPSSPARDTASGWTGAAENDPPCSNAPDESSSKRRKALASPARAAPALAFRAQGQSVKRSVAGREKPGGPAIPYLRVDFFPVPSSPATRRFCYRCPLQMTVATRLEQVKQVQPDCTAAHPGHPPQSSSILIAAKRTDAKTPGNPC